MNEVVITLNPQTDINIQLDEVKPVEIIIQ